mmetsp:Transcript_2694/g.5571  ORF Transcript_2694/g.5571 Transcript_2694/m.5571 type:complete len:81 (+) Transcript_2694:837-1079(+)
MPGPFDLDFLSVTAQTRKALASLYGTTWMERSKDTLDSLLVHLGHLRSRAAPVFLSHRLSLHKPFPSPREQKRVALSRKE